MHYNLNSLLWGVMSWFVFKFINAVLIEANLFGDSPIEELFTMFSVVDNL